MRSSLFMQYDADLDPLMQTSKLQESLERFVESTLGLDNVIVERGLGAVNRYADHQVWVGYGSPGFAEPRVGEATAVRENMDTCKRQEVSGQLQQLDQALPIKSWLSAREENARCG